MSDLDALLAGIVADPHDALRWLVMADWLDDHGQSERAELVRVHRELLRTCTDPDAHPERPELHARMMELMRVGVQPCIPQRTLILPDGVELPMSFIPPGSFLMGSPETEPEREDGESLHLATLARGYWLGVTPVTQAQWVSVMGENPFGNREEFRATETVEMPRGFWGRISGRPARVRREVGPRIPAGTRPVESVNWDDAVAFCAAVNANSVRAARLPTEAEWEYACRAGTSTPYYWGDDLNGTQANCDGNHPCGTEVKGPYLEQTSPVGYYADESPHPWGLADVHGNVWEWCADRLPPLSPDEVPYLRFHPTGPDGGSLRVYRGGGWYHRAGRCRSAYRRRSRPDIRDGDVGFRIAADPSAPAGLLRD